MFIEKREAENLQHRMKRRFDGETFLDDGDERVNSDGDPDLSLHGILGGAEERFDAQVLFYP